MTRKPAKVTPKEKENIKKKNAEKDKISLDDLVSQVKTHLGSSVSVLKDVEVWVSTGIPRLDIALGGGFPFGRLTTLIGKKSVGKSTLSVHMLAQIQKLAGLSVALDAERANMRSRCLAQGIDEKRLIVTQPQSLDTFEQENMKTGKKEKVKGAFQIMEDVIKVVYRNAPETLIGVVLDSVAGSSVASEIEADYGKAGMGKHARILSQAFRKIMPVVEEMNICFILVNQLKEKIGVVFGNPTTYIGKNPIDFHSSITMEMVSGGVFPEKSSDPEGIITKIWVSKNKVGKPFGKVQYVTFFDRGIDTVWETIDFLYKDTKVFGETPGWLIWDDKKYRQKEVYEKTRKNPGLAEIFNKLAMEVVHERIKDNANKVAYPGVEISATVASK